MKLERVLGILRGELAMLYGGRVVAEHLTKLRERIAAAEANGANVARAKEVAQRAARLHGAATEDLKNGRRVPALVHATMAADLLASLHHR